MAVDTKTQCRALDAGLKRIKSGIRPQTAWESTAKELGVDLSTVYRWYQRVHGRPRADWPKLLAARYQPRKQVEIESTAWTFYLKAYESTDPPSMKEAYRATRAEAEARGWDIPSSRTFERRLSSVRRRRSRYDTA